MYVDIVLTTLQIAAAVFFMLSGYHKVFLPERHEMLKQTMVDDGLPWPKHCAWFVAYTELFAGIALLVTTWAAVPLLAICLTACIVDAPKRIREFDPVDFADRIDDWLYLPETWLVLVLIVVLVWGAT